MSIRNIQGSSPPVPTYSGSTNGGAGVLDACLRLMTKYEDASAYWFLQHRFYKPGSKEEKKCLKKADYYTDMFISVSERVIRYAKKNLR
jgi:hypothetical protein